VKVRLSVRAQADLLAQLDWLVLRSPDAARAPADQIEAHMLLLGQFPEAAPSVADGFREAAIRFGRDGFVVRYRVLRDHVLIVRLFHGAPGALSPTASRS